MILPPLAKIAALLGGDVNGEQVLAPGPGHSTDDRSLSVKPVKDGPDGFVVNSFAGDDPSACRDYVREKLALPKRAKDGKKNRKGNGASKPWSPIVARYVYRQADGTPYLQVCRTAAKGFFQNHWNGQMWVPNKPSGPKIPYKLPELIAATPTTWVHITEGEKDADALAALGFVATTNSEGAGNWTADLNEYFRDRHVYVHEDNDGEGRKRGQHIARGLDGVAASVRVVRLPGLPPKGDVSDWLEGDPSGTRLVKECESTPLWEPTTTPGADTADKDKDKDDADLAARTKKQADVLIELASAAKLFHTPDDVGFATFEVNGHQENWAIRSKGFKRWLARGFYESTQGAPNSEAMQAALGVLEARAQYDAPEYEVHIRVAGHDGRIYIDLCDETWRAIEIDGDGWQVIDNPPVRFRRSAGMKALPEPVAGGSLEGDLRPLLNVKNDASFVLAVAWLLAALRDRGPYPNLAIGGEQGTAKSMLTAMLRALVDPNSVPLRALPRNEHDVFIAARNSHVLAYDNASGLPDWLSDTLCRLATGGGFSTRQLYTDEDEMLFASTRPAILNGIEDIVLRPDLADRAIFLTLAPIPDEERKLETELWEAFERKCPRILGALLTAVAHGLKTLPDVELDRLPRMADFATWVTACEGAISPRGRFMAVYTSNLEEGIETVLEADQVATALRKYMESVAGFEGNASDLLQALNGVVSEMEQKAKGWPKRPQALGGILRRVATPLRKVGVEIAFNREGKRRDRRITITLLDKVRKTSSASSTANDSNDLGRTHDDEGVVRPRGGLVRHGAGHTQADNKADNTSAKIVRPNALINNKADKADKADNNLRTSTGRHSVCTQCGLDPPDGAERFCAIGSETVWLHPQCEQAYLNDEDLPW